MYACVYLAAAALSWLRSGSLVSSPLATIEASQAGDKWLVFIPGTVKWELTNEVNNSFQSGVYSLIHQKNWNLTLYTLWYIKNTEKELVYFKLMKTQINYVLRLSFYIVAGAVRHYLWVWLCVIWNVLCYLTRPTEQRCFFTDSNWAALCQFSGDFLTVNLSYHANI